MKILTRRDWALLALVGLYSFVPAVVGLLRIPELLGGVAIMPPNPRAVSDPAPIILHVVGSSIFCLVGAFQFLPGLRRHRPKLHRRLGRIVAVAGAISALTGLWMTIAFSFPDALQGPLLFWVRIGLSILMFCLIVWAVRAIRVGRITQHKAAMLRAYAIGQGASTQTAMFIAGMLAFDFEPFGFPRDVMMVAAWLINLAFAEVVIRRSRPLPQRVRQNSAHRSSNESLPCKAQGAQNHSSF